MAATQWGRQTPTIRATTAIAAWAGLVLSSCGPRTTRHEVTVVGGDYFFQAPDTLASGPTSFHFQNVGTVAHELVLARLKAGVTPAQALDAETRGADIATVYDQGDGLLYVVEGDSQEMSLLVDLLPGRTYVLLCSLDGGPQNKPHVMLGMFKAVHTTNGAGKGPTS